MPELPNDKVHFHDLDPAKIEAIQTTEGPVLIIAGHGSGKTRTLVERILYLVYKGIPSESIMVATFTEKAAKELITGFSNRLLEAGLKVNLNEMYIGTLHSIFLRILEENREYTRLKKNYRMLDDFDQKYFLFRNLNPYLKVEGSEVLLGKPTLSRWDKVESLVYYLAKVGEECLDLERLANSNYLSMKVIAEFYKIYSAQLVEENALDFSTIRNILEFPKNFPDRKCKQVTLATNFRSHPDIYRRQLEVYAYLVEERTGSKVSKIHLYYPKVEDGSPYITFPANKDNVQVTIDSFEEVVHKIESKDFDMKHILKSEKQCGDCDMRYHCNPRQYSK